jgi:hypothetical protein
MRSNSSGTPAGRWGRSVAVSVVLLAALGIATAGATGATVVEVSTVDDRVDVSETTTVQVVVENVEGGVGAYDLVVELSDSAVASIAEVELVGGPRLQTVEVSADGARANLTAAGLDTSDSGSVAIASVRLSGDTPGTTDVTVSVSALGDEDGTPYAVETAGASVTVAAAGGTAGDDDRPESTGDGETASASDDAADRATTSGDGSVDSEAWADGVRSGAVVSTAVDPATLPAWILGTVVLVPALFAVRRLL